MKVKTKSQPFSTRPNTAPPRGVAWHRGDSSSTCTPAYVICLANQAEQTTYARKDFPPGESATLKTDQFLILYKGEIDYRNTQGILKVSEPK